jgi:hypothetical protein
VRKYINLGNIDIKYLMLNIYTELDQIEYWLSQTKINNYAITNNVNDWMHLPNRISVIEIRNFDDETHQLLEKLVSISNHVIVFVHELINDSWIQEFDRACVTFFVSGTLNYKTRNSKVYFYPYFISSTTAFYHSHPEILDQLDSNPVLQYDVLLGRRKPHRDQVFALFDKTQNVIKYFPDYTDQDIREYNLDHFEWPDVLPLPIEPITMTAQEVIVSGTIVSLSQIIPTDIYNRTRYSFVVETEVSNQYSFFTEKIVKPMLGRRLFVVVSGQHYLRNLRSLGFRTFNGIVDETYDLIPDTNERIAAACYAANSVKEVDRDLLKEIVEHNYQHLMSTNWDQNMIEKLEKVIIEIQ